MIQKSVETTGSQTEHSETRLGIFVTKLGGVALTAGLIASQLNHNIQTDYFSITVDSWVSPSLVLGGLGMMVGGVGVAFAGIRREDRQSE